MRNTVISLLVLVLALFAGACAGRQVRVGMPSVASVQAPSVNREFAHDAAVAPQTPTVAIEAAPTVGIDGAKKPTEFGTMMANVRFDVLGTIQRGNREFSARMLAESIRLADEYSLWARAEMEKINDPHMTPSPSNNDELVAQLESGRPAAPTRVASRPHRKHGGLAAASTSVKPASKAPSVQAPDRTFLAASAAPIVLAPPAPAVSTVVTAAPAATPSISVPPAGQTVLTAPVTPFDDQGLLKGRLIFVAIGACLGLVFGALFSTLLSRRSRRDHLVSYAAPPLPPGGKLLLESRDGKIVWRMLAPSEFVPPLVENPSAADSPSVVLSTPIDAAPAAEPTAEPTLAPPNLNVGPILPDHGIPLPGLPPERSPAAAPSKQISSQGLERHHVAGEITAIPEVQVYQDVTPPDDGNRN